MITLRVYRAQSNFRMNYPDSAILIFVYIQFIITKKKTYTVFLSPYSHKGGHKKAQLFGKAILKAIIIQKPGQGCIKNFGSGEQLVKM